jgi:hypothetical protein
MQSQDFDPTREQVRRADLSRRLMSKRGLAFPGVRNGGSVDGQVRRAEVYPLLGIRAQIDRF